MPVVERRERGFTGLRWIGNLIGVAFTDYYYVCIANLYYGGIGVTGIVEKVSYLYCR